MRVLNVRKLKNNSYVARYSKILSLVYLASFFNRVNTLKINKLIKRIYYEFYQFKHSRIKSYTRR